MHGDPVNVSVPGGLDAGGTWSRALRLRPCTGQDEAWLLEDGAALLPAERASELLGRCLAPGAAAGLDGGGRDGSGVELARLLTLGDREALLLHLRRLTVGDRLQSVVDCESCGDRMDIEVRMSDLVLPAYVHEGWEHQAKLDRWLLRFRLPNGGDQEAAARAGDVAAGVETLLHRCVREVRDRDGAEVARLPAPAVPGLSALMAERDPQAEVTLTTACPRCAAPQARTLDAGRLLEDELAADADDLYREVHLLASVYHWSQAEILSLPLRQRRRYLALIADGGRTL